MLPWANTYAWLGLLVTLVDRVAGDYVFGPSGSDGRPKVAFDMSLMHSLDICNLLTPACQSRWQNFMKVWHQAGWDWARLDVLTDDLRLLQYGSGIQACAGYHCISAKPVCSRVL